MENLPRRRSKRPATVAARSIIERSSDNEESTSDPIDSSPAENIIKAVEYAPSKTTIIDTITTDDDVSRCVGYKANIYDTSLVVCTWNGCNRYFTIWNKFVYHRTREHNTTDLAKDIWVFGNIKKGESSNSASGETSGSGKDGLTGKGATVSSEDRESGTMGNGGKLEEAAPKTKKVRQNTGPQPEVNSQNDAASGLSQSQANKLAASSASSNSHPVYSLAYDTAEPRYYTTLMIPPYGIGPYGEIHPPPPRYDGYGEMAYSGFYNGPGAGNGHRRFMGSMGSMGNQQPPRRGR
ncbi:3984_t:CDS:2 [Paraglomus brasilianum]|uniref:3984_t:CDS:1 n=1 Tax=Paraglomus brasilianum TaxID=144538 RepID=A0A9N8VPA9_9GLOM|nr:3984_t:CDS:2 [Paraglomus brasilianum]